MEEVMRSIEFNKTTILFGFQLFQLLGRDKECLNSLISPLSLHVVLGLLFMGSKGKTKEELVEGLHISDKIVLTAMLFHHAICKYKNKEALKINNKFYIQKGLKVKGRFKLIAKKIFRTEIESINLKDKQRSAIMINAWVSSKTEKRINKIVLPTQIDDDTTILIVSSITFKCNWKYHFNPALTKESNFTTSDGNVVKVQMMTKNKCSIKYRNFSDLKCSVFELPFADRDFAFVIFFPRRTKGFDLLEQQLPLIDLVKYRRRLKTATVEVNLPKFKMEYTAQLSEPLKELGLNSMFDKAKAELSNIIEGSKGVCVGQVFNKAHLAINEYGVDVDEPNDEMGVSEKTGTVHSVKLNRPFLFAVVSRRHRLFFWGAVRNPNHVECRFPGEHTIVSPVVEDQKENSKENHPKEDENNIPKDDDPKDKDDENIPKDDDPKDEDDKNVPKEDDPKDEDDKNVPKDDDPKDKDDQNIPKDDDHKDKDDQNIPKDNDPEEEDKNNPPEDDDKNEANPQNPPPIVDPNDPQLTEPQ